MKKIWEFFENMDECMYVADIDTHELIYMNKKALNIYGFKSVDEVAGKKCYEILQNSSSPCKICNNEDLSVGQFNTAPTMASGFLNIPVPIIPKFRVGHYALHNTVSMRVLS